MTDLLADYDRVIARLDAQSAGVGARWASQIACAPCVADDGCFGGKCTPVGIASFCLEDCSLGAPCSPGYTCDGGVCQPDNGTCDCTARPPAVNCRNSPPSTFATSPCKRASVARACSE